MYNKSVAVRVLIKKGFMMQELMEKMSGTKRIKEFFMIHGMDVPSKEVADALGEGVNDKLVNVVRHQIKKKEKEVFPVAEETKVSASKRILDYLKVHGKNISPKKVAEELQVDARYVSQIKSKMKGGRRKSVGVIQATPGRISKPSSLSLDTLSVLTRVKNFADELGGFDKLADFVSLLRDFHKS